MNHRIFSCISVAALLWANAAHAQQSGDHADQAGVGDIIVTARRVSESLQDVPLAVSALNGQELQAKGVRQITDLSSFVPNLVVQGGNAGAGSAIFTLRGQSQSNILLTVDPAVGLYIDGVNIPRPYGIRTALVDIERVEVLRGPQGTLYGRNTTGGAVSFVTKDPGADLGGQLQFGLGNYHSVTALGILNIPVSETAGLRLVAQHIYHDGYDRQVLNGQDLQREISTYVRATGRVEAGRLTLRLSGDYTHFDNGGLTPRLTGLTPATATQPVGAQATREVAAELGLPNTPAGLAQAATILQSYVNRGNFHDNFSGFPQVSKIKIASGLLKASYELSNAFSLNSITGYRWFDQAFASDNDGTPFVLNDRPTFAVKDRMFSQEVQLVGKVGNVDLQLGGFYSRETGTETSNSISIGALTANRVTVTDADVTSKTLAFFGQASWRVTDRLSLTGGARWTRDIKAVQNRNGLRSGAGVFTCGVPLELRNDPAVCAANLSNAFAKPSWLASLDYRFSPQLLLYAKVARGFRAGGQNQRGVNSVPTFAPFRPETVTEYEAGIKADLFDRRLRINVAAFHDDYSDVQRTIVVLVGASTSSVTSNAAKATLNGFEAEVTARPTSRLTLSGTLGLLDPKYGQFIDFTGDRSNEEWPAPKINYSLGARYVLPASFGDVSANVDWRWTGRQNLVPSGALRSQLTQPAFGLLNARLSATIKSADTDIALFGTNLLDQNYYTAGIAFEALGFNQLYTGDPRVIGVQVTKRFGVF